MRKTEFLILSISATSVPFERHFSDGSNQITAEKTRIKFIIVNNFIFKKKMIFIVIIKLSIVFVKIKLTNKNQLYEPYNYIRHP